MRARFPSLVLFVSLAVPAVPQQRPAPQPPKLVVAIVIDQFRYDYLTRFRSEYTGGLKRLLDDGASFTNAHYQHVPTVTAAGHSTFLTGATPALSGIIGNEWWDRTTNTQVTSVSDTNTKLLGASGAGSSPRRLLQSTIGDELKSSGKGGKVIGVSMKDRAAILPAGSSADGAYWFDAVTGNFVSSTYYFESLPTWVTQFNDGRPSDEFAEKEWLKHKMPPPGPALNSAIEATPFANELIHKFAVHALTAEKLGTGPKIDVLTVSYSGNDYVGHRYGPDSEEVHDAARRVDTLVGDLIQAAESQAGAGNVLVVLTADHGVAPVPEENQRRRLPGGRLDVDRLHATIDLLLHNKFGGWNWISFMGESGIYLNPETARVQKADLAEAEATVADALRATPHVFRAYTRTQLLKGEIATDPVGIDVRNGFSQVRSGNVTFVLDPYWIFGDGGTTHGAPFDYDTHVPILFFGAAIKPGRYDANVAPNDIAPTLATLLDIETPSGSVGRVLSEMLK
jgi:predicted AlkP superfamily pyrophosphatase or phosphodiesterase